MSSIVEVHDAEQDLSGLIDRLDAGEEIVVASDGVPRARLMPIAVAGVRSPAGAMRVTYIAGDFDAPDPMVEALFGD
jgi:prevent-host-death family protein